MQEEEREKYRRVAFGAWLRGAGEKKKFGQYLKHLKLDHKKPQSEKVSKEETKAIVERNKANAQRILLLDKQNRKG